MTALNLPSTATIASTATAVQLAGHHSSVEAINLGSVPVWVRTDGGTAVAKADLNYVIPPFQGEPTKLQCSPSGGTLGVDTGTPVTNLSMITSSSTADVFLCPSCCED